MLHHNDLRLYRDMLGDTSGLYPDLISVSLLNTIQLAWST